MRTFSDTQGRQWCIDINIGALKRVKTLIDVDLLQAKDGETLLLLADDPMKLADVLFALVQPMALARGVSDEDFGAALGGDTMRAAADAFVEELIDFFLKFQPATGKMLQTLWNKLEQMTKKAEGLTELKLADPRVDQVLEREIARAEEGFEKQMQTILGT